MHHVMEIYHESHHAQDHAVDSHKSAHDHDKGKEWILAAMVLDRVFFVIFLLVTILTFALLMTDNG